MRANTNTFGKTRQLNDTDFAEFEAAFGDDPYLKSPRIDQG
jgi:type I restriction enzyme M protein